MAKSTSTPSTPRKSKAAAAKDANSVKVNLEKAPKHEITPEQAAADQLADEHVKNDAMASFVNQLGGGAAPAAATPPVAMEAFQKEMEALKVRFGVTADVKVKPVKADKKMQNGVVRPGDNTLCGKIFATADAISKSTHGVCAIAALKEHPDMHGINDHTIKTQYAKWRAYNGVTGRLPKLHAVHQVQGEYDGIAPVEPKANDGIGGA